MGFGYFDHSCDAFRIEPVVGMYDLAVFAVRRHLPQCDVAIRVTADEGLIIVDAYTMILFCIFLSYRERAVSTTIVDNAVLPILIGLGQYTFNTLRQILLAVVYGREHAN
jgi:hypothetical protein